MKGVQDEGMTNEMDSLTAHDLREQGSLKWTRFGGDTIGAFVAEMDFGTAAPVQDALRGAVSGADLGYLAPRHAEALAREVANFQQEWYRWRVAPEQVCLVSGVLTALQVAMRHFSPPDRPIIVPTPAYMPFLSVPPLHGREVIQVPMIIEDQRYALDLDGIDRAYRAGGHLLVLCNPWNPVGRVLTAPELTAVTEVVDRHGGRVFADEVHAPLVYPGHRHLPYAATSPTAAAHTITATSASKAWNLGGLKCAQVILDPSEVAAWQRVTSDASVTPSTLGVVAATAAYRDGEPWLEELLDYLDRNRRALRDLLAQYLPQVRYRDPEGTYLAWLDCRELVAEQDSSAASGRSGAEPAVKRPESRGTDRPPGELFLERAGVAVVEGTDCGEAAEGHVRLNFATPLPILERIVTRISRGFGLHQP